MRRIPISGSFLLLYSGLQSGCQVSIVIDLFTIDCICWIFWQLDCKQISIKAILTLRIITNSLNFLSLRKSSASGHIGFNPPPTFFSLSIHWHLLVEPFLELDDGRLFKGAASAGPDANAHVCKNVMPTKGSTRPLARVTARRTAAASPIVYTNSLGGCNCTCLSSNIQ